MRRVNNGCCAGTRGLDIFASVGSELDVWPAANAIPTPRSTPSSAHSTSHCYMYMRFALQHHTDLRSAVRPSACFERLFFELHASTAQNSSNSGFVSARHLDVRRCACPIGHTTSARYSSPHLHVHIHAHRYGSHVHAAVCHPPASMCPRSSGV